MEDEYTIPFGRNNYCGPCALAYVLRTDPDTAAARLRAVSGKRAIRGTHDKHILAVLKQERIEYVPMMTYIHRRARYGRLVAWAAQQPLDAEYLVITSWHYVVLHRGMIYDSFKHLGVPVDKSHWARTFVRGAWWIKRGKQ